MSESSVVVAEAATFHTYAIVREYAKILHNKNVGEKTNHTQIK
jgi:hypothetical protein